MKPAPRMKKYVEADRSKTIAAYNAKPGLIAEHHGIERVVLAGGYGYRQVLELVQNGADAQLEPCKPRRSPKRDHRIEVRLCDSCLYVANTGKPFTQEGVDALLSSHRSPKRGKEIGRFGLGFKSLLALGGRIDVFTRNSGAIRFDPERCGRELKEMFRVADVPALRLAWPLDDVEYDDPVVAGMRWAETIVRAELQNADMEEQVRNEISGFPAEFLLFFLVGCQLILDDGTEQPRELRLERDGDACLLHDGDSASKWLVVSREVKITDEKALADATEIHQRDAVPMSWAVPLDSRQQVAGAFWAFFPTQTPTHLAGILNAPWKLNSDRNAIIPGEWNRVLMRESAKLVAETLPRLSSSDDPGRPLDAFPRQLERKDDIAAELIDAVWAELEKAAVVADATGTLRDACELGRPPRDSVELARQWEAIAALEKRAKLVHSSCLEGDRRSRLDAFAKRIDPTPLSPAGNALLRKLDAPAWFGAVASKNRKTAKRVLELAEAYEADCKHGEWERERPHLRVIPSVDGLLTADEAILAPDGVDIPGREAVATALSDDAEARRILIDVMKVTEPNDSFWQNELRDKLSRAGSENLDANWRTFWKLLRLAPEAIRNQFVESNKTQIRVHRRDGSWVPWYRVLLPGRIVAAADDSPNQKVLVNKRTHEGDEAIVRMAGVADLPGGRVCEQRAEGTHSLSGWLDECRWLYKRTHRNSARRDYLDSKCFEMPCGWDLLPMLSGGANAELTSHFLSRLAANEFCDKVDFGHSTMSSYQRLMVQNPLAWLILKYGKVRVGDAVIRVNTVAARLHKPAISHVVDWAQLLPSIEKAAGLETRKTPTEDEISDLWLSLIDNLAVSSALADGSLCDLWRGAGEDGVVPDELHLDGCMVPLERIYVTTSPDLASRASKAGFAVVTLDSETYELWLKHGAIDLTQRVQAEWAEALDAVGLLFSFPEFAAKDVLSQEASTAHCRPVSALHLRIGKSSEPLPCLMWEGELLVDNEQLSRLSRADRLKLLLEAAGDAGWLQGSAVDALAILGDSQVDERRAKVAEADTLAERLLRAVGGRREPLQQALGHVGHADFVKECELPALAELVLSQLGPAVLNDLRDALRAEGLNPPSRWGSAEAREFVASIGFPDAFAASTQSRREAEETISGPIDLGPLHEFQKGVLKSIRKLVRRGNGRRRAVISLPTGAGKTRVTVQAAIELVLKPEGDRRSVLWIAQTGELCEQAVQAFRQVWINRGAKNTDLRIVRLWDSNPNPAAREPEKPVVVVASIQTAQQPPGRRPSRVAANSGPGRGR